MDSDRSNRKMSRYITEIRYKWRISTNSIRSGQSAQYIRNSMWATIISMNLDHYNRNTSPISENLYTPLDIPPAFDLSRFLCSYSFYFFSQPRYTTNLNIPPKFAMSRTWRCWCGDCLLYFHAEMFEPRHNIFSNIRGSNIPRESEQAILALDPHPLAELRISVDYTIIIMNQIERGQIVRHWSIHPPTETQTMIHTP